MANSNSDVRTNTASAISSAEELKEQRKQRREKFLNRIRANLSSVTHQVGLSPAEAGVACGKSPTWAYRKIYAGKFRVITADGRMLIPRSELEHYLAGAEIYNPQPKKGVDGNGGPSEK
jgi:hypothetical protein